MRNGLKEEKVYYKKEKDYYVCGMGEDMKGRGVGDYKRESGYIGESMGYRGGRCEGCGVRCMCLR